MINLSNYPSLLNQKSKFCLGHLLRSETLPSTAAELKPTTRTAFTPPPPPGSRPRHPQRVRRSRPAAGVSFQPCAGAGQQPRSCPTFRSARGSRGPGARAARHGTRTRSLQRPETPAGVPTPLCATSTSGGRKGSSAPSGEGATTTEPGNGNVLLFLNWVIQDGQSSRLTHRNTEHTGAWGPRQN